MSDWYTQSRPNSSSDPSKEGTGARKRQAEGTPPAREEIPIKVIEDRFEANRQNLQHTISRDQAAPSVDQLLSQPLVRKTEYVEEKVAPFNYLDIPMGPWKNRCALAVHDTNPFSVIGSVEARSIDWTTEACVNVGRLGFPHISLIVHVADPLTGRPLDKQQPCKTAN
ncbi:MAG: hypothetical protein L6R42_000835 [Xanthoria sp. 1 TBL-2021]|nr:MAG: hypothetical protein L6R42_000835 [Xanthoria sp. 1 TBL-2021]